jgi:ribonuclease P/MRP protein subunit POP1
LYKSNSFPLGLLGPATILWRPLGDLADDPDAPHHSKGARKRKGRRRSNDFSNPDKQERTVWLRCHPAMFDEVQAALQDAAARTLDNIHRTMGSVSLDPGAEETSETIEIVDLRGQVNAFEIMGPKSTSVLMGVLDLVKTAAGPDLKTVRAMII